MAVSKDPLAILFGSQARVKLLRFFLFNPQQAFSFDEISRRAKLVRRTARTELNALEKAEVIKKRFVYEEGKNGKKRRVQGYVLNKNFPQLVSLQSFLFETAPINGKTLLKHVRKVGKLDFVASTGVFMREFDRRVDILMSAKKVSQAKMENAIRALEAELGIEIRFALLDTPDLLYRVGMCDKLTRDVFDYPHEILIDRIGVRDEIKRT
jgi:DNA-binding transcriptional ArsR family regulator